MEVHTLGCKKCNSWAREYLRVSELKLESKNARKRQTFQWLGIMLSTFTIQMESGISGLTYSIKTEFTAVESKKRSWVEP